ncbi:MAG: nuclear transport factor 2 family protein, partial [Bacteroidota bacterium]
EAHSKIIHPDFIHISSTGKIISREQYLKDWAHGYDGMLYWDYRDEFIKIYGNMALVHAVNKYQHEHNGKVQTGMAIYTDTYIKENGKWLCVQAQITNVSAENQQAYQKIIRKYDANN